MKQRRCTRCGTKFVPERPHYQYCSSCFNGTQPVGWTSNRQRSNAPDRHHGGVSRLRNERRSVILRGHQTRVGILEGLKQFFSDLYEHPVGLSSMLAEAGMTEKQIAALNADGPLNSLVMDFCPDLRKWLIEVLGYRGAELLIEHFGFYGDEPVPLEALAPKLRLSDERHAQHYLRRLLRILRNPESQLQLEKLALNAAMRNLPT